MSNPLQTYLGLKLSLISKSGCRYVGILHSISQEDATVSLREVTSMGTENRPAPQFIPAAPQVFDFIVFKGSDVQDLSVMNEQPAPPPVSQLPNDPAIMHAGGQPHSQGYGGMPPPGPGGMPPMMQPPPYMMGYPQQQAPPWAHQPSGPGPAAPISSDHPETAGSNSTAPQQGKVPTNAQSSPTKPSATEAPVLNQRKPDEKSINSNQQPRKRLDGDAETEQSHGGPDNSGGKAKGKAELTYAQVGARKAEGENGGYRGGFHHRGRGGYRGGHGGNRGGHMRNLGPRNRVAVPDSDFDFETANAKFNKMDLAKEKDGDKDDHSREEESNVSPEKVQVNGDDDDELGLFYNKTKSFFDNISCETKERSESSGERVNRRARQYEERRLNLETFGQMGVDGRGYRRGGPRGAYTGGRGFGGGYNNAGGGRHGGYRSNYSGFNNRNNGQSTSAKNGGD
ncbi:Scd6-like Sm domain-containing protein [Cladochytrium replicatum]|nr:Scd6-like Sm domain-containing protein [Cladochytrium replicatum]